MSNPTIEAEITAHAQQYPLAAEFVTNFFANSIVLLRGQIEFLILNRRERFWPLAEKLLHLNKNIDGEPERVLLEYTLAIVREQAMFMRTGEYKYSTDSFQDAYDEVYNNPDVMQAFYLEGLLMTHAFWPIHLDMHHFFESEFLTAIAQDAAQGAEFGFGHGLYLYEILQHVPSTQALGYDISQYAVEFATHLLQKNDVPTARFSLGLGDVRESLPHTDNSLDWVVFAEVLEHIPNPQFALREIARCLKPNAPVFVTSVVDSNAVDHLWLFKDLSEIDTMLTDNGLQIKARQAFVLKDYDPNTKDPTIDVAYVCTKA